MLIADDLDVACRDFNDICNRITVYDHVTLFFKAEYVIRIDTSSVLRLSAGSTLIRINLDIFTHLFVQLAGLEDKFRRVGNLLPFIPCYDLAHWANETECEYTHEWIATLFRCGNARERTRHCHQTQL